MQCIKGCHLNKKVLVLNGKHEMMAEATKGKKLALKYPKRTLSLFLMRDESTVRLKIQLNKIESLIAKADDEINVKNR